MPIKVYCIGDTSELESYIDSNGASVLSKNNNSVQSILVVDKITTEQMENWCKNNLNCSFEYPNPSVQKVGKKISEIAAEIKKSKKP